MIPKPIQQRRSISLDIRPGKSDSSLKVAWRGRTPFSVYSIDRGNVQSAANRIRKSLDALVDAKREDRHCALILKQLAKDGQALHKALFRSDNINDKTPRAVRDYIYEPDEPSRIDVTVDGYIHIPWGLIFDGAPNDLPDETGVENPASYEGFWCLKYLLSCAYHRISPRPGRKSFRLFPVIHEQQFTIASSHVPEAETSALNGLLQECAGPLHSKDQLFNAWNSSQSDRILYFYCHANGKALAVNERESITLDDFREMLDYAETAPNAITLTFLNGCSTAVVEDTKGFLQATSDGGFCGFVGTETKVPNVYALRFGTAFLRCFMETGWQLVDVMDAMRRQHWPLSLVYGLYGYSELRVDRTPPAEAWPASAEPNFSRGPIGATSI